MRGAVWALGLLLWMPMAAHAESGVLVPGDKQAPAPSILSLTEMQVEIRVDNGDARVWVRQVAVYDLSFEPLWPAELVKSYYELLAKGRLVRKTSDALRARLAAHPEGGADALKDAAKLFYIDQQQDQLDAAKAVLEEYRACKEARGAAWDANELYTLGRLLEAVQDFPEAARYYYALAAELHAPIRKRRALRGSRAFCSLRRSSRCAWEQETWRSTRALPPWTVVPVT